MEFRHERTAYGHRDYIKTQDVSLNLTEAERTVYGVPMFVIGGLDLLATVCLFLAILAADSSTQMKPGHKLLLGNVIVPDFLTGLLLVAIFGPAAYGGTWHLSYGLTIWVSFLKTFGMFHGHLALTTVCGVLAMSLYDVDRYEMINSTNQLSLLIFCTTCLTISMCSLPATERQGYTILNNWVGPSFNIHYQYGSIFMCAAMLTVIIPALAVSVFYLIKVRSYLYNNVERVDRAVIFAVERVVLFSILSLVLAISLAMVIIGAEGKEVMQIYRGWTDAGPTLRVLMLVFLCPFFRLRAGQEMDIVDEVALVEMIGNGTDFDGLDESGPENRFDGVSYKKTSYGHFEMMANYEVEIWKQAIEKIVSFRKAKEEELLRSEMHEAGSSLQPAGSHTSMKSERHSNADDTSEFHTAQGKHSDIQNMDEADLKKIVDRMRRSTLYYDAIEMPKGETRRDRMKAHRARVNSLVDQKVRQKEDKETRAEELQRERLREEVERRVVEAAEQRARARREKKDTKRQREIEKVSAVDEAKMVYEESKVTVSRIGETLKVEKEDAAKESTDKSAQRVRDATERRMKEIAKRNVDEIARRRMREKVERAKKHERNQ